MINSLSKVLLNGFTSIVYIPKKVSKIKKEFQIISPNKDFS